MGFLPGGKGANFMMEFPNRGKRSIAIDLSTEGGQKLLYALAGTADVFLTSYLPDVRQRLRIDVEHIRSANPNIIYVRGHGFGARGPDRGKPGFDSTAYWSRGGVGDALTTPGSERPATQRPGFGDVLGGANIAGGIAAALFAREKTGLPTVVDASLLGTAMWNLQPDVVMSEALGLDDIIRFGDGQAGANPLVGMYGTKDHRWITLNMMQADRFWPDFCAHIGQVDLIDDPRFADAASRSANRDSLVAMLEETFASRTLNDWKQALSALAGAWAPMQRGTELATDVQVRENGYLRPVVDGAGNKFHLVAAPIQFDEQPPDLGPAPELGADTDEILLELGLTMEEVLNHKIEGAIL
jgi:crotonobetainyl-CoA:carnitine CoA-transferase CaiB-like acyl-CoA transferase